MRKNKMMAAAFAVMMSVSMVGGWQTVAEHSVKAATSQARFSEAQVNIVGTLNPTSNHITGILPTETNAHFYKLNLTSGGKLHINGNANGSIDIAIVDLYGNTIYSFWVFTDQTFDKNIELAKGNYYIKVYTGDSVWAGRSYDVNTYFKKTSCTFAENSNDDFFTASSVKFNQVVRGHIAENNAEDYYKINFPAKGKYPLIYKSENGAAIQWILYNSNYEKISDWHSYDGGSQDTLTIDHKGTYYIKFTGIHWDKPTYWFKVVGKTAVKVTAPKATYIKKLTKGSKRFKVNVKKQSATGYQVQYSLKSNFKGSKTKIFKGTSYTVKGLKGKKKYYVRVRSYKKSGSKTLYSAWSGKKSVKTKK